MGQKVNPNVIRLLITKNWSSKWYGEKNEYTELFHRDLALRQTIQDTLKEGGIGDIEIERSAKKVVINIFTSKPGVIIGRHGAAIDDLKAKLENQFKERFEVNIKEIKKPELSAVLVVDAIARQIEKRIPYRRAAKGAIDRAIEAGAIGIKIFCGGRLNGVEIARSEYFKQGNIPLQTFRSQISYACDAAYTTYGKIGIKVWVYTGDRFKKKQPQLLAG